RGVHLPAQDGLPVAAGRSSGASAAPVGSQQPTAICIAIVHLREPMAAAVHVAFERHLNGNLGILAAHHLPSDGVVAVRYDQDQITLGDIVRAIEDFGSAVSS